MKLQTLERYIKYTTKNYSKLLELAQSGGLSVTYDEDRIIIVGTETQKGIILYPYKMDNLDYGMQFISYGY